MAKPPRLPRGKSANSSTRKLPGQSISGSKKGLIEVDCYAHKGSNCGLCSGTGKVWVGK